MRRLAMGRNVLDLAMPIRQTGMGLLSPVPARGNRPPKRYP
jgi:hypothetical protein